MVLCLLLLKEVGPPMGPPNSFPQFLYTCGGSGHGCQSQGKSEGDINRESGFSSIRKVIGAEPHGGILGTVLSMDQCYNTALPVRLMFWRQHLQHINEGEIESLTLVIHLGMVQTGSEFFVPINLQRSAISSLSRFLPWSERIFSGNP